MTSIRTINEGEIEQGKDESIPYSIDVTNWCLTPANPVVEIFETGNFIKNVSSKCLRGSPSVSGSNIITPFIEDLVTGKSYRVEVKFTTGVDPLGTKLELYFVLNCTL